METSQVAFAGREEHHCDQPSGCFSEAEAQADRRRVLHVFHCTGRGGIETAMMQLFRRIDRDRYRFDFLVRTPEPGAYDDEIRALGGRIVRCLNHRNPLAFARGLGALLAAGRYHAVHSHIEHYTGIILPVAAAAGVPVRIAHIHNDRAHLPATVTRRAYRRLMAASVARFATHGFAPSAKAARFLFGPRWPADHRWRVLPYGLDFAPYRAPVDRAQVRASLGVPDDALVVGHVGRFDPQKNHGFLIRVLQALAADEPRAFGLLIGDGRLRPAITSQVERAGLGGRVVFAGVRADVPALLKAAVDVFLFPSLNEGLGLVLVEAQAAGLPAVISDVVPAEADVLPERITRLPLAAAPGRWADAVRAAAASARPADALARLERSPFALERSLAVYRATYDGAAPVAGAPSAMQAAA